MKIKQLGKLYKVVHSNTNEVGYVCKIEKIKDLRDILFFVDTHISIPREQNDFDFKKAWNYIGCSKQEIERKQQELNNRIKNKDVYFKLASISWYHIINGIN